MVNTINLYNYYCTILVLLFYGSDIKQHQCRSGVSIPSSTPACLRRMGQRLEEYRAFPYLSLFPYQDLLPLPYLPLHSATGIPNPLLTLCMVLRIGEKMLVKWFLELWYEEKKISSQTSFSLNSNLLLKDTLTF